jgi:hypothetical protein
MAFQMTTAHDSTTCSIISVRLPRQLCVALVALSFVAFAIPAFGSDPRGVWRGEWTSNSTGHRGPMRVAIRQRSDGMYQARFTGRFFVVIPFTYGVTMVPSRDAMGNTTLSASKRLGLGLGSYTMQTAIQGNRLQGSFRAAGDRGTVSMRRIR